MGVRDGVDVVGWRNRAVGCPVAVARRGRLRGRLPQLGSAVLIAVLGCSGVSGCGGGSGTAAAVTPSGTGTVEVSAFRAAFCQARATFGARMSADAAAVAKGATGASGVSRTRAVALGNVDALVRDFNAFAAALRAAGVPRVAGGDAAAAALSRTMQDATSALGSARATFVAAKMNDVTAYNKAAAALRSGEQNAALGLESGLAGVVTASPALDKAIFCS
jgi:hypothetical protein